MVLGLLWALPTVCPATAPQWISFEDDEVPPFYGFIPQDRGRSLGLTAAISRDATPDPFLVGDYSAYLAEPWDRVSLPIGITEGLVQFWFYDDNYGAGPDGTEPNANAIRLRSEADDPKRAPGWPLHYLSIDLKGQFTGPHSNPTLLPYYTVAKNGDPDIDMGVEFGYPVGSVNDQVYRATETWNLVTFDIDHGVTTLSVNREMVDIVEANPLSQLELLCRSGWYQTRPGEARVMRWDGIAVLPKLFSTDFSSSPEWMNFDTGSSLVFASTREGQTVPFDFIPGSTRLARFTTGGQRMHCPWRVKQGAIEIWLWDNRADEGSNPDNGNIDIVVSSDSSPADFVRMRTYETVMGTPAGSWYLVTPQSPPGMGGSLSLPRQYGWNKMVFHKTPDGLVVSLNGDFVSQYSHRWDNAPDDLMFEVSVLSSGYDDGFPLWLGRIVIAGRVELIPTFVTNWEIYE